MAPVATSEADVATSSKSSLSTTRATPCCRCHGVANRDSNCPNKDAITACTEAIAVSCAQATYHEVQRLQKAGLSIRQIAHQLKRHRATVRKYFSAETFPEWAKRQATLRRLDDYLPYLELRLQTGCENATQLWRELCEQGYYGRYPGQPVDASTSSKGCTYDTWTLLRCRYHCHCDEGQQAKCEGLPSYKKLSWLIIRDPEELAPFEVDTLQRIREDSRVEHALQPPRNTNR